MEAVQTPFNERVYAVLKRVPKGRVTTYKAIAHALGTGAYRAVGTALNRNPYKEVPCHRVVNANGHVGGFMHGTQHKIDKLHKEGIIIKEEKIVNFSKVFFDPSV